MMYAYDPNKLIKAMNFTYIEQNFTPWLICHGKIKTLLLGVFKLF
jgi:hypothetical protein